MRFAIAFAILCLVPCLSAQDNVHVTTGNELMQKCRFFFADLTGNTPATMTNSERIDMGYCAGYLDGVTDVEQTWDWVEGKSSKAAHYCMPNEVTKGQMLLVIKKWMEDHPAKLHEQASYLIHDAFLNAFPCKH